MSKAEKQLPPEKLFADISQFVSESKTALERGAMMELAGLDERVKMLCEAVLELSQDDRVAYAEQLQHLLNELKLLGESMVAHRDALTEVIRGLPSHQKASVAYRVADASAKPKDKK